MGNRLSRIYTRTGDDGSTGLGDGSRTGKDALRVNAYGTVDEANSAIGVLLAAPGVPEPIAALLTTVQHQFRPRRRALHPRPRGHRCGRHPGAGDAAGRLQPDAARAAGFILPAGGEAAARCHLAPRTIVRRAERETVALSRQEAVRSEAIGYLNRLSDLLFVLARVLARADGQQEVLWRHDRRRG
ncbi:ATP:cob(I)alamin adenosyltransferase (plasmid) [Xanthomonas axonopodis pv. vasculorum]